MSLRDALDATKSAEVAATATKNRDDERERVRAKMPDEMRSFVDKVRDVFPGARLIGVKFPDGERIGKI